MAGLQQKYPNAILYVVGDGPALRSARALVDEYQVKAVFTGKITHKETLALLATFDILAIPRRRTETTESVFPIKLLEAMALGVPVIITGHESLDFLSDGRDVIFCEPESGNLSKKIDFLLSSPVLSKSLKERGKEISKAFDYEVLAERLVQDLLKCKTN
jgi:glycosyltransferase involved in cell wall biosynthesis